MAEVKSTSSIDIHVILKLTEVEARALEAIVGYGIDPFLETFYKHLGKAYLQDHEAGAISLFNTVREEIPKHLKRADDARDIWRNAAKNES